MKSHHKHSKQLIKIWRENPKTTQTDRGALKPPRQTGAHWQRKQFMLVAGQLNPHMLYAQMKLPHSVFFECYVYLTAFTGRRAGEAAGCLQRRNLWAARICHMRQQDDIFGPRRRTPPWTDKQALGEPEVFLNEPTVITQQRAYCLNTSSCRMVRHSKDARLKHDHRKLGVTTKRSLSVTFQGWVKTPSFTKMSNLVPTREGVILSQVQSGRR